MLRRLGSLVLSASFAPALTPLPNSPNECIHKCQWLQRSKSASFLKLTHLAIYGYARSLKELARIPKTDLQGTLDLLVLKTLSQTWELHGYGIVLHIQRASEELLSVGEGSLYPALHRMEQNGWISSEGALTEANRRTKYYGLTTLAERSCTRRNRASSSWLRAFAPFCGTHEEFLCQFFSVSQISSFVLR
jgi:PadR family transcriptional regulator PadR